MRICDRTVKAIRERLERSRISAEVEIHRRVRRELRERTAEELCDAPTVYYWTSRWGTTWRCAAAASGFGWGSLSAMIWRTAVRRAESMEAMPRSSQ